MNPFFRFFLLIFLSLLLAPVIAPGQDEPGGLYLTGKITTEQGRVDGAVVKMTLNGQQLKDYEVLPDGKFNLRFEFNNEYTLVFTRRDNFPQKVVISTKVPSDVLRRDRKFPPYPLDINLFTEVKGVDRTFSENAILKIFYSPSVDNFIPEVYYNNAQIKRLIDQAIWQSQHVTKESDLLKKISAAELAEMKKEYNGYLKKAGAEFDKQEYINALGDYKSALRIFPDEQYPKDRIAEIKDLIAVLGLQAELDRQMAEKYARFIQIADQQFIAKNYIESKENYSQALMIKPEDTYASGRLTEIDKLMAARETDQKYQDFISLADKAFSEKLWDQAKSRYNEAIRLKPGESYPIAQIAKIDGELQRLVQQAEKKENFETAVLNGDAAYNKQFYSKAIAFYETALTYEPENQGVKSKIDKCRKEQKVIADKLFYDETIASADKAFNKKEYEKARELYSTALSTSSGQSYPQKQIDAIDRIFDKNREFTRHITDGDALLINKEYLAAKEEFSKALLLKPGEGYPAEKIKQIDGILASQEKAEQDYRQLIAAAEKLFNENKMAQAKTEFQKAATLRPADPYPPQMLSRIAANETEALRLAAEKESAEKARLLAEQEAINQKYKSLIDEADQFAEQGKLVEAVGKFRSALEVKPRETYPLKRIEEIRGIIVRQTEMKKTYDAAILMADKAFKQQQYPTARTAYQQAQQAKSDETYPGEMIAKIDAIEAEQARLAAEKKAQEEASQRTALEEKERQYTLAINGADAFFTQKQYPQAITGYTNALKIKPGESYPREKITESEKIMGELAAAKKAYEAAILTADKAFKQQQYPSARTAYQQAQQAKPDETYPGEMIAKIDAIEAEQARLAAEKKAQEEASQRTALEEKERQYTLAITGADAFFTQKQYPQAITGYTNALKIKPGESYPREKITESQRIMGELAAAKKAYDAAILTAEKAFKQQQYPAARTAYQLAQQAKPDETYPGEMIAKIDAIEAEQARLAAEKKAREEAAQRTALEEKERQYTLAINDADAFFTQKQYPQAISGYTNALKIKPGESYPKEKITESEKIMGELAAAKKAYDAAILTADKAFKQQQYPAARTAYQQAQQAKPDETYPGEMIAKIDAIEAEQARLAAEKKAREEAAQRTTLEEKERQYNLAITGADAFFTQKQYAQAITGYTNALKIKPGESYPKEKITESEKIMGELATAKKAYDAAILTADIAFKQQQYPAARTAYQQAQQAKPDETYPGEMIAKIDAIEAEQARLAAEKKAQEEKARLAARQRYDQAIGAADKALEADLLDDAEKGYAEAGKILPGETYPAGQIARITELRIARVKDQIRALVEKGDNALTKESFDEAEKNYGDALRLAPSDREIAGKLADAGRLKREKIQAKLETENKNKEYIRLVTLADRAFQSSSFRDATSGYRSASEIKPAEIYPKTQMEKIDSILKVREADEQYRTVLVAADAAFRSSNLEIARENYLKASGLKPGEPYPQKQIGLIDEMIRQRALRTQTASSKTENTAGTGVTPAMDENTEKMKREEADALYTSMIASADQAFTIKEYNVSRAWYYKALEIKPGESYPSGRIREINALLANMQLSQLEREFQQYIDKADESFRGDQLAVARSWYNRALGIKENDKYARSQLMEIQIKINERLQGDTNKTYEAYMEQGNKALDLKEFSVARVWFQRAIQIKHGDEAAMSKLEAVRKAMVGEK